MTIAETIELLKREGSHLGKPIHVEGMPEMVLACSVAETGASPAEIAQSVAACPPDLFEFWRIARTARLFEDESYGQWGLKLFDPHAGDLMTQRCCAQRGRDFMTGDFVIGEFLGDSDLLLIRCESAFPDFGSVLVVLPIDPREEWYRAANSLSSFLDSFVRAGGDKFWETS